MVRKDYVIKVSPKGVLAEGTVFMSWSTQSVLLTKALLCHVTFRNLYGTIKQSVEKAIVKGSINCQS